MEQELKETLSLIAGARYLHEACQRLLEQFSIKYVPVSPANLPVDAFLEEKFISREHNRPLIQKIREVCVVGIATQDTFLTGNTDDMSVDEFESNICNDKYQEMAFFSIDAREHMTRTEIATLTRAFNRRMVSRPVVLFVRSGNLLSMATCERTDYVQSGHTGQKAGRVTILRDIDCSHPHRGHLEILSTLDLSGCKSYDELYARWLDTFSNELLTRKFYSELSDWYAWAVQVAKFPNDLSTTDDDAKFNHESCIRLITRLIFVWFLKQKKLIPEEFFDEQYIRENLIAGFDPHERKTLLYDAGQSKYYRLILQNLFFAMLNRPIVAEDKTAPNNRRFRKAVTGYRLNSDYNVNNLMRYEADFMPGGAEKFMRLANTSVPFLNGGLFDCLDDKPRKLYYDGFSERRESLEQLSLPDYLFFGDEVGRSVDLSQWYDDKTKKAVSARGLIDILKRYSFTIEENTPLDQEVSLDPELLGKVFENLLASFNPETKTSARKQTGSFYTPREIVQYMVDESLVAHLKRMCGDGLEPQYRALLSYASDDVELSQEQRGRIMAALYNCRVLDPACGSGAFPMGMLQQMVHVLKRIDPTNQMWNKMMVDLTIEAARRELEKVTKGNEQERQKIEANRQARLDDIESAFNQSVNDPDYARKLYLIEHCIHGVDIQPIATQISKLRFFISLVVDQKPTDNARENFGIRPLPNLEAKFVTANTLIPLDRSRSLFTATDDIRFYEEQLRDLNHRIFLAKRNKDKQELRQLMMDTRRMMAMTLENLGAIGRDGYAQLTEWNMFDQNASASFFDPEWMFGVKEGFDIVIANPPYVEAKKLKSIASTLKPIYSLYSGTADFSIYFSEAALRFLAPKGVMCFITSNKFFFTGYGKKPRRMYSEHEILRIINFEQVEVFENVLVSSVVLQIRKAEAKPDNVFEYEQFYKLKRAEFKSQFIERKGSFGSYAQKYLGESEWSFADMSSLELKEKISKDSTELESVPGVNLYRGVTTGFNPAFIITNEERDELIKQGVQYSNVVKNLLQGRNIRKWYYNESNENLLYIPWHFPLEKDEISGASIKAEQALAVQYPHLYNRLISYKEELSQRNKEETGIRYEWYALQRCAASYSDEFEQPKKIIWGLTADKWAFTLDEDKHYLPSNGYILTSTEIPTEYILGLLNSKLMHYYFQFIGVMTAGGAYTLKAATISALPIRLMDNPQPVISLVKGILSDKRKDHNADVSVSEQSIDHLVYHLYGLTYDEVLVIDPETPITREEYDNYKETH